MPAVGPLSVEEVAGLAALADLGDAWTALLERCPRATPFQRPEWLLPFGRRFPPAEPWLLAVRESGRLVGLAPLFVYREGGQKIAAPLGAGITDYLDFILDDAAAAAAVAAVFAHLDAHRARWDVLDLEQLPPGSPLLAAPAPPAWHDALEVQDRCPALALPERLTELGDVIPARQLKALRRARRLAEEAGPARLEIATAASRAGLMERLFRLHRARWIARGQPGVVSAAALKELHREVSAAMDAGGALRLYGLRLGAAVVAVLYGFARGERLYLYLQGFDPAYARFSPGLLLLGAVIEDAVTAGVRAIDFLRGQEPYKYAWGARDRLNHRRRLRHPAATEAAA